MNSPTYSAPESAIGSAVVFAATVYLARRQRKVGDVASMKAMIPHHSMAILTSSRALITEPRVRQLADNILAAQRSDAKLAKWSRSLPTCSIGKFLRDEQRALADSQKQAIKRTSPDHFFPPSENACAGRTVLGRGRRAVSPHVGHDGYRSTINRMPTSTRVHILGASGSGTTTLGRHLAAHLECPVFDADDFYWLPSDPPFRHKRTVMERLALIEPALAHHPSWVLSGSLASWEATLVPRFTHVIFLTLAPAVRLERLRAREVERYGADRLCETGDLHPPHVEFVAWAARYDVAGPEQRSLIAHEAWLAQLPTSIRVLRLDSALSPKVLVECCVQALAA